MKPFNLDLAKQGKPVCTRNGQKVRILCFDAKGEDYPILALVDKKDHEEALWYTSEGIWDTDDKESPYDLMMVSEQTRSSMTQDEKTCESCIFLKGTFCKHFGEYREPYYEPKEYDCFESYENL